MNTLISRLKLLSAVALITGTAFAQQPSSLKANETQGFGDGKLLVFAYEQNFDCIDQPQDDGFGCGIVTCDRQRDPPRCAFGLPQFQQVLSLDIVESLDHRPL